jgi:hypothetical protein
MAQASDVVVAVGDSQVLIFPSRVACELSVEPIDVSLYHFFTPDGRELLPTSVSSNRWRLSSALEDTEDHSELMRTAIAVFLEYFGKDGEGDLETLICRFVESFGYDS